MKHSLLTIVIIMMLMPVLGQHCGSCPSGSGLEAATISNPTPPAERLVLTRAGKKYWLDDNHYVKFSWNRNPRIGNYVLLINVFDKTNRKLTNLNLTANAYMPSMRGAHDTGDRPMQLNRAQQYAINVHFMMLGDWEIELKIKNGNRMIGNPVVRLNI